MDRAQLLLVGLPLFLFFSDVVHLFTPPPPKPNASHHHHRNLPDSQPVIRDQHPSLEFETPKASGVGYGNTVSSDFCASCSYRGTAVTMKNMLESQFPGINVVLANYPAPLPKRLLSKLVPVFQFGVIGIIVGGEQIFPRLGFAAPPQWYYSLRANRFGSMASTWLLGNFLQSFLQSSGAFEVYSNRELALFGGKMILVGGTSSTSRASVPAEDELNQRSDEETQEEGGKWTEVSTPPRKAQQDREVPGRSGKFLPEYLAKLRAESSSYYFTNFPPSWQKGEMWKVFSAFGQVSDIHVPRQQTLPGSRFGFVRFLKKSIDEKIVEKLNGIWVGSFKVRVSEARAPSDSRAQEQSTYGLGNGQNERLLPQVVRAKEMKATVASPLISVQFTPDPKAAQWLDKCLVGMPAPINDIKTLNRILKESGYEGGAAVRLEGGEVLLKLLSTDDQQRLLEDKNTVQELGLHSLRPWRLINGKLARPVWIQIRGTPLYCWYKSFFVEIAAHIGSLVSIDEKTTEHTEMQYGRLQVMVTDNNPINMTMEIVTGDEKFNIQVTKEQLNPEGMGSRKSFHWGNQGERLNKLGDEWPVLTRGNQGKKGLKEGNEIMKEGRANEKDPYDQSSEMGARKESVVDSGQRGNEGKGQNTLGELGKGNKDNEDRSEEASTKETSLEEGEGEKEVSASVESIHTELGTKVSYERPLVGQREISLSPQSRWIRKLDCPQIGRQSPEKANDESAKLGDQGESIAINSPTNNRNGLGKAKFDGLLQELYEAGAKPIRMGWTESFTELLARQEARASQQNASIPDLDKNERDMKEMTAESEQSILSQSSDPFSIMPLLQLSPNSLAAKKQETYWLMNQATNADANLREHTRRIHEATIESMAERSMVVSEAQEKIEEILDLAIELGVSPKTSRADLAERLISMQERDDRQYVTLDQPETNIVPQATT